MPDWIHSLLYLFIFIATVLFSIYLTENIWGALLGLPAGHIVASAIVSRLPGFWGDRDS